MRDWEAYHHTFFEKPKWKYARENRWLRSVIRKYIHRNDLCLDFGSGSGHWMNTMRRYSPKLVGIDIDFNALSFCKKQDVAGQYLMFNTNLPFPANTFDFLLIAWVIQEISSDEVLKESLRNIHRVLKPSGIAVFAKNMYPGTIIRELLETGDLGHKFAVAKENENDPSSRYFPENQIKHILTPYGFRRLHYSTKVMSYCEVFVKE